MKLISVEDSFTKSLLIFIAYEIPFGNFANDLVEYVNKFNVELILFRFHIKLGLLVMLF